MIRQIIRNWRLPVSYVRFKSFKRTQISINQFRSLSSEIQQPFEKKTSEREISSNKLNSRSIAIPAVDWSEYMSDGTSDFNPFTNLSIPQDQWEAGRKVRESALNWLMNNTKILKPYDFVDVINLFCFTETQLRQLKETSEDVSQLKEMIIWHEVLCNWFVSNYDKLLPRTFFQVMKSGTVWNWWFPFRVLAKRQPDLRLSIIAHGVELAKKGTDINSLLHLLFSVELFGDISEEQADYETFSEELLQIMESKEAPSNQLDLLESLRFLSSKSTQVALQEKRFSSQAVFHRHANGNYAAWKWLQNTIELVFENDDFSDLRQMAAVVAVRAYKWKAIDYSPDDIARYLKKAAEPFTDPAFFFAPIKSEFPLDKTMMLDDLIFAIRSAVSDESLLDKLSLQLDDTCWNNVFAVIEKEAAKLAATGGRRSSFNALIAMLELLKRNEKSSLSLNEKRFLSIPFGEDHEALLLELKKRRASTVA